MYLVHRPQALLFPFFASNLKPQAKRSSISRRPFFPPRPSSCLKTQAQRSSNGPRPCFQFKIKNLKIKIVLVPCAFQCFSLNSPIATFHFISLLSATSGTRSRWSQIINPKPTVLSPYINRFDSKNIAIIITMAPGNAALPQWRYVIATDFPQDRQVTGIPGLKNIFLRTEIAFFSQCGHLYTISPCLDMQSVSWHSAVNIQWHFMVCHFQLIFWNMYVQL